MTRYPRPTPVDSLPLSEPWERLVGESEVAYRAFSCYMELPPERRTLVAVQHKLYGVRKRPTDSGNHIRGWRVKYRWDERALAWDRHLEYLRRREIEEAERATARKWAARREQLRDTEFELGEGLLNRLREMMKFPVKTITTTQLENGPDGQQLVQLTIEPAGWNTSHMALLLKEATAVMHRASAVPDEKMSMEDVLGMAEQVSEQFGVPVEELVLLAAEASDYLHQKATPQDPFTKRKVGGRPRKPKMLGAGGKTAPEA